MYSFLGNNDLLCILHNTHCIMQTDFDGLTEQFHRPQLVIAMMTS